MNTTIRFLLILAVVSTLIVSCGGAAPEATQPPAATEPPEPPAATEAPAATEPPAATEAPVTEAPGITETPAPQSNEESLNNLVVILVVDNFSKTEPPAPEQDGNCAVTPDGQGYTSRESATMMLGQPHGIFVYTDLIDRQDLRVMVAGGDIQQHSSGENFTGTDMQINGQEYPWIKRYDLYEFPREEKFLLVVAVDTDGLKLDSIQSNIATALTEMSASDILLADRSLPPAKRFVINMSFVLIPCNPLFVLGRSVEEIREEYDDNRSDINGIPPLSNLRTRLENLYFNYSEETLTQLQGLLRGLLGPEYTLNIEQLLALEEGQKQQLIDEAVFQAYIVYLIYDPGNDRSWQYDSFLPDGFFSTLEGFLTDGLEIVYVGAAGNFSQKFSYAPASWDFVDSISSEAAGYSNWGEVQMNGIHPLSSEIVGTSFAAPKFSYQIAQYLLLEGGTSPCNESSPALGYATTKDPWPTTTPDVFADNNLPFVTALPKYCP